MKSWYQVTLLRSTLDIYIPLAVETLSLLSKLVTHIPSVIHGLMVHHFRTTQETWWTYCQLLQQSQFWTKHLYIWFNHCLYVLFCKIENCFTGKSMGRYYLRTSNCTTIQNKVEGKLSHLDSTFQVYVLGGETFFELLHNLHICNQTA